MPPAPAVPAHPWPHPPVDRGGVGEPDRQLLEALLERCARLEAEELAGTPDIRIAMPHVARAIAAGDFGRELRPAQDPSQLDRNVPDRAAVTASDVEHAVQLGGRLER
jgi:hypothetical protein